jgi:REP element-mobilizing transposase RayT
MNILAFELIFANYGFWLPNDQRGSGSDFVRSDALAVARGFENEIKAYGGVVHACAIMPRHTHRVVGPPRYDIRRFAGRLKGAATKQLIAEGIHPLATFPEADGSLPSPWSVKPWVVYLFTNDDVMRCVDYTNENPLKSGRPRQNWDWITEYAGRR